MPIAHLPEADLFAPASGEPSLRWGLIGPGWIAGAFVDAAHRHTTQRFIAVASRSQARAERFARDHGIDAALGSVAELLDRPDIDAVYVATPQSEHAPLALQVIAAGKHVLVEKPFTVTAAEAQRVLDAAAAAGLLAMEAMWARYLPQTDVIRRLLRDGVLGEINLVLADHGQAIEADPHHRLMRPDLGGGALLDLGIYPVQFASMVLGEPATITARGGMTSTGVDAYSTITLDFADGAQAALSTTITARTPTTAAIGGSKGLLQVAAPFYAPSAFTVVGTGFGDPILPWTDPTGLQLFDGLSWEATAFARFVGDARIESPLHTRAELLSIMKVLDASRAQVSEQSRIGVAQ